MVVYTIPLYILLVLTQKKFLKEHNVTLNTMKLNYLLSQTSMEPHITCYKNNSEGLEKSSEITEKNKTLEDDLIELMLRHDIIKDKNKINEKHLEFIKYAIELYKSEQNNK